MCKNRQESLSMSEREAPSLQTFIQAAKEFSTIFKEGVKSRCLLSISDDSIAEGSMR